MARHVKDPAAPRVLVADDADTIRTLLTIALEAEGFEVLVSEDGVETFTVGCEVKLDLVIIDQLMPGYLGLEVMEKWNSEGIDMPVIMLSAVDDPRTAIEAIELGARDFIRKPFLINELVAKAKAAVNS